MLFGKRLSLRRKSKNKKPMRPSSLDIMTLTSFGGRRTSKIKDTKERLSSSTSALATAKQPPSLRVSFHSEVRVQHYSINDAPREVGLRSEKKAKKMGFVQRTRSHLVKVVIPTMLPFYVSTPPPTYTT
jgi:hypothetical protein